MKKGIILGLMLLLMMTGIAGANSPGDVAADFTLYDINGKEINLSSILAEKPVLLDFWATWCPPCRRGASHVQEFHEKYKDKVAVIGININESRGTVSGFMERLGLTYTMVIDSGEVAREYGVVAIPSIVLIDKDRKIVYFGHSVHEAEQYLQ